jgi:hypothetical protein
LKAAVQKWYQPQDKRVKMKMPRSEIMVRSMILPMMPDTDEASPREEETEEIPESSHCRK